MIHLTWISSHVRGARKTYDTNHAGEALVEAAGRWYASGDEHPERRAVFCVVVERDDCELTRAEILQELEEIVSIERWRTHDHQTRKASA